MAGGGKLEGCSVESEEPSGFDYAQATLGLVPKFTLTIWTAEGLPVIGGAVRFPMRFSFTDATPAPAPKP